MFQKVIDNHPGKKQPINETSKKIQKRAIEIFQQQILYQIEQNGKRGEGKLVFYGKLKYKYNSETYLKIKNLENRNALRERLKTEFMAVSRLCLLRRRGG